jgi:hypothetical protein
LDLGSVPGLGSGSAHRVNCTKFVITEIHGNTSSKGESCVSGLNATLWGAMRQKGGCRVRIEYVQQLPPVYGAFESRPLQVTSIQILSSSADISLENSTVTRHRKLKSFVSRPVVLLTVIIKACGVSAISTDDLYRKMLPTYSEWFKRASYGRSSLDPRSRIIQSDVNCNMAQDCSDSQLNSVYQIADYAKQQVQWSSNIYTNLLIVMPDVYQSKCTNL